MYGRIVCHAQDVAGALGEVHVAVGSSVSVNSRLVALAHSAAWLAVTSWSSCPRSDVTGE